MRRPRERAHFRGTVRYCSANAQERGEQGRPDDLWCLLYILVELRGALPWSRVRDRDKVLRMKINVELESLLHNCPVELLSFARHLRGLNYYTRPDYSFLFHLLEQVMDAGAIRFSDPYDWEKGAILKIVSHPYSTFGRSNGLSSEHSTSNAAGSRIYELSLGLNGDSSPFSAEFFATNPLGF